MASVRQAVGGCSTTAEKETKTARHEPVEGCWAMLRQCGSCGSPVEFLWESCGSPVGVLWESCGSQVGVVPRYAPPRLAVHEPLHVPTVSHSITSALVWITHTQVNGLEQILINFANEYLQNVFNKQAKPPPPPIHPQNFSSCPRAGLMCPSLRAGRASHAIVALPPPITP